MLRQFFNTFVPKREKISVTLDNQTEEKLQFPELYYRGLFESMDEGFASCQMIYDKAGKPIDFRYLYVNSAFAKLTGLPVERVVGRTVREVIPKIEPFWIEIYGRVVQSGKSEHFENGVESIGKQFEIKVWRCAKGCFAVLFDDITGRKKEEAVAESKTKELENSTKSQEETKKAMLNVMEDLEEAKAIIEIERAKDEAMLASIGEGLMAVDDNQKVMMINKSAEKMFDLKTKDIMGKGITGLPLEDEEGHILPLDKQPTYIALSTGKTVNSTYFFVRKDKTKFPIAIIVTPIKMGGKIIGALDIFRDITREKEIDKAKSEFVSLASHQLRTPLSAIKWYSKMLLNEDVGKTTKKQKEYLEEIHSGNERMVSLVNALLSVSRIELGTFAVQPKKINIVTIGKEVIEEVRQDITHKQLILNEKFKKVSDIEADPSYIRVIFQNLISNAIKYTPGKGAITITITENSTDQLVSVKDTGFGIPEKSKGKIFTKLYRADNVVRRNTEGTGLGLYITKSIVEQAANGKIWFESEENKGTTFFVSLPLKGMIKREGVKGLI